MFNPWRNILVRYFVMVRADTLDKCLGLEPVWLGKGITSYDNNKDSEMYGKFKIEWW